MNNRQPDKSDNVACACGLRSSGPWELVAHFLVVYPPHAESSVDGTQHADPTRLAVKLGVGASGTWEVTTWATAQRKDLRVAASVAHRVKTGELKRWDTILPHEIRNTYHVSMHVVAGAIEILKDFEIIDNRPSHQPEPPPLLSTASACTATSTGPEAMAVVQRVFASGHGIQAVVEGATVDPLISSRADPGLRCPLWPSLANSPNRRFGQLLSYLFRGYRPAQPEAQAILCG